MLWKCWATSAGKESGGVSGTPRSILGDVPSKVHGLTKAKMATIYWFFENGDLVAGFGLAHLDQTNLDLPLWSRPSWPTGPLWLAILADFATWSAILAYWYKLVAWFNKIVTIVACTSRLLDPLGQDLPSWSANLVYGRIDLMLLQFIMVW